MNNASNVGQDGAYKTPEDQYDAEHGKYADPVERLPDTRRLPIQQMPAAPDPDPFRMGNLG